VIRFLTQERWSIMAKEDKIHIKLEICKDEQSHGLTIMTHFDESAPNFFKDKEGYFWVPTVEEKDFLNEAFELAPSSETKTTHEKPVDMPSEKKEEAPAFEPVVDKKEEATTPEPIVDEKEETPLPEPTPVVEKEEEKTEELPLSPFENKEMQEPVDMPSLEQTEKEEIFEVTREEPAPPHTDNATKEEDKGVIVEADDHAIEKALKKRQAKEDSSSIVAADEKTIVEKVLSQKKKGKWSRVNH